MAKKKVMKKKGKSSGSTSSGGFSLHPKDATSGGFFGPGRAKVVKAKYGLYNYKNKAGASQGKAMGLIVTYRRPNVDEKYEKQEYVYTMGKGYKASADGKSVKPLEGQTGVNKNTKLHHFAKSLLDCGAAESVVLNDLAKDATILVGASFDLLEKPLPKFSGRDSSPGFKKRAKPKDEPSTVLVVGKIIKANFDFEEPAAEDEDGEDADESSDEESDDEESDGEGDNEEADEDEESEESDEESEEDEEEEEPEPKAKKKKKAKPADDDEEEEEEESSDDDEESEDEESGESDDEESEESDDDDALLEEGTELLMTVVAKAPAKLKEVELLVRNAAKKSKKKSVKANAAAIGKLMANPKTLKKETAWSFDGKKVSAAEEEEE